jgi:xanthine permease
LSEGEIHPVDQRPPAGQLVVLAFQHVITMYAGAVTVPLVIGAGLHLAPAQTAYLVSADLLACGIVSMIQCLGIWGVGVRLPVIMGVTFVGVAPAIAIASNPQLGLPGVFGATIVSGFVGMLIAPLFGRAPKVFAPVVIGMTMLLIGLSLVSVGVNWIGGPSGAAAHPANVAVAALVAASILAIVKFGRGFVGNIAILLGVSIGFVAACALGWVNFSGVASADWLRLVQPFYFGLPKFDVSACVSMTLVMVVATIESSGMLFSLGRVVERPLTPNDLTRGLRGDAAGAIVGGLFSSLPYTSYSQNVAVVAMTGVRSRFVCAVAGVILILLAAIPKLAFLVTAIPNPVLGGAALVMFGMVAANGIQVLAQVDYAANRKSLYVVALGLGVGLIPIVSPKFLAGLPSGLAFLQNGVLLGILTTIGLNLLLNSGEAAPAASVQALPDEA